nr:MAG TPA: hypothetical protein [Caudoviricetes sp.]
MPLGAALGSRGPGIFRGPGNALLGAPGPRVA